MTLSRSGYLPLAFGVKDWRKEDQYPALKPLDNYTRDDYLPLAWELPRRMPRYRRQYRTISTEPLSVQSMALIVKRAAKAMGREREEFSGPQPSRRLRDPGGDGIWLATITLGARVRIVDADQASLPTWLAHARADRAPQRCRAGTVHPAGRPRSGRFRRCFDAARSRCRQDQTQRKASGRHVAVA